MPQCTASGVFRQVTLNIATNRMPSIAGVTSAISGVHSNIEARTGDNRAEIAVTLDIVDLDHLEKTVSQLEKIEGVYQVERVTRA